MSKMGYTFYIISFLLFSGNLCAQKIEIGGDWSGYKYSHLCPYYSFSYNGKTTFPLNILEDNHISLASKDCVVAIEKAKKYIEQRGGPEFSKHVDFQDIDITYPDSLDALKSRRPLYDLTKCGDTKYYVRFLFHSGHRDYIRIGVALNDQFELLSPLDFPDVNKNSDFYTIIEPLEAYRIALKKHKKLIDNADIIRLVYEETLNSFIWEIVGPRSETKPKSPTQTRIDFKNGIVWINATTGKIDHADKYEGYYLRNPRYF